MFETGMQRIQSCGTASLHRDDGCRSQSRADYFLVLNGVAALTDLGLTGGDLLYDYGVNLRGLNPLFEQ